MTAPRPNRFDATGARTVTSTRWRAGRLNPPNRLWGSNGVAFGPDGRLYVAQFLAGQISAVDTATGGVEVVVPAGGPVRSPDDLAFGADGSMYIADLVPGRVWRRGPEGGYTLVSDEVKVPNGITCVGDRLFVNELHPDGRTRDVVPRGLDGPYGVTVGLGGTVYVGDHYRLADPTPSGEDDVASLTLLPPFVHGVAAADGLVHLTSQYGEVHTHDPGRGTTRRRAAALDRPVGITVGPDGALVVAEAGAGRVVAIGDDDVLTVLAEGLDHPVDVAFDALGRCHVSDDRRGAVLRIEEDGTAKVVADGLGAPQGPAVRGDELFTVEVGHRRLLSVSLTTGETRVDAEDLPVGSPPAPLPALSPRCSPTACPACRARSPASPSPPTAPCSCRPTVRAACGGWRRDRRRGRVPEQAAARRKQDGPRPRAFTERCRNTPQRDRCLPRLVRSRH
ncbi:hypothetical protein GCM10009678_74930 [Actinomadura kijaniata]|uniref:Sugar lactone lactonase YvrE n=1 Tax=Actinomadura namibiensis TaxID=182080 RepID=A0A7W3LZV7_ACTNM|nr:hypothetical protein [Actinomadura namibiensis]MBA8957410.1 sugar lactone lactonase YvrE [Actinomadura namibiensis]